MEDDGIEIIRKSSKALIAIIFILEIISLPIWFFFSVLSIPGSGNIDQEYWLMAGPTLAYPALMLAGLVASIQLLKKQRFGQALLTICVAPMISFLYPFIHAAVVY